jgi:predicted TIM-barrel fold metal-dependent hydrolase
MAGIPANPLAAAGGGRYLRGVITDFHAHAFPDALAARAMQHLTEQALGVKPYLDGRASSLLASMDRAGIARVVICSIATRPEQFDPILNWSRGIASDRIVPLLSVHPRDPRAVERIDRTAAEGFKGVKLHPYYQDFVLDDPDLWPIYRRLSERNLVAVCHTGYDFAFPRERRCEPARIAKVARAFPDLKLVATHMGAWEEWDDVERFLIGRRLYFETSFSLHLLPPERARAMILAHPPGYVLFGTDSPWRDQSDSLRELRALGLGAARETAILSDNADGLLG